MQLFKLLFAVYAALVNASAAYGHASLVHSEPADRAVVERAPAEFRLTFNEPVAPLVMRLASPSGTIVELAGKAIGDGSVVALPLPSGLANGTFLLSWRVVSADGHPVAGTLTFSIGQPSAAAIRPQPTESGLRISIWLARLVLYLGLFVGVGGAFFQAWIAGSPLTVLSRSIVDGALIIGLLAALLSAGLHGADLLGLSLAQVYDVRTVWFGIASPYGWTLCVAAAALALGLVASAAADNTARWLSALSLFAVGAALAASGHAASTAPQWITRPALFLHAVCVAFWLGALLPLLLGAAGGQGNVALARFSRAVPAPFFVLIATGLLLAVVQVPLVKLLWTTSYGFIFAAKLSLALALFCLAGLNRWLTPRVLAGSPDRARRFRLSVTAEIVLMAAILGLVSSWRFTPPPRALQADIALPIRAHLHSDRAIVDLEIGRTVRQSRRIMLVLQDGVFAPLTAKEVTLFLGKPDAGIEPLRHQAMHEGATRWRVDDVFVPMPGRWRVRIEILINDFEKFSVEDEIDLT